MKPMLNVVNSDSPVKSLTKKFNMKNSCLMKKGVGTPSRQLCYSHQLSE